MSATRENRTSRADRLKAVWNDPVWSKIIAAALIAAFASTGAYVLHRRSVQEHVAAEVGVRDYIVPTCNRAVLNGNIQPNGVATLVWFEWGPTPNLGNRTPLERFTEKTDHYAHITGLQENTTYFFRGMASNVNGVSQGRVISFTTPRC